MAIDLNQERKALHLALTHQDVKQHLFLPFSWAFNHLESHFSLSPDEETQAAFQQFLQLLHTENEILFTDHLIPLDFIPLIYVLIKAIESGELDAEISHVIAPFAFQLISGVDPEGRKGIKHIPVLLFHIVRSWFLRYQLHQLNQLDQIDAMPVIRELELKPHFRKARRKWDPDKKFNIAYKDRVNYLFSMFPQGVLSILSPVAGLHIPPKQAINPFVHYHLGVDLPAAINQSEHVDKLPVVFSAASLPVDPDLYHHPPNRHIPLKEPYMVYFRQLGQLSDNLEDAQQQQQQALDEMRAQAGLRYQDIDFERIRKK